MRYREQIFIWEWDLASEPEQLWPYVSDADRFNRDIGFPEVEELGFSPAGNKIYRYKTDLPGINIVWEEETYEWIAPFYQRNVHRFQSGIWETGVAEVRLRPRPEGGTHLTYAFRMVPRNALGLIYTPFQMRLANGARMDQAMRHYDQLVQARQLYVPLHEPDTFVAGGRERLAALQQQLIESGQPAPLVELLTSYLTQASELDCARLRPYALADAWQQPRRAVLELFLYATRLGVLALQWEMLCPYCRNAQEHLPSLSGIQPEQHCDYCNVDFAVSFEQSVELVFRISPRIRETPQRKFCTGGPQFTPHILLQQIIAPGEELRWQPLHLEHGRYRIRSFRSAGSLVLQVRDEGSAQAHLHLPDGAWSFPELTLAPQPVLYLHNASHAPQTLIIERMAWGDQAVTAAEVTALQTFRDLFSSEALRPDAQIAVGTLTIMFTDLRQSSALYQEIGDAPAFGLVMRHFDVLHQIVQEEGGAIVKTIGDAVMAVFRQPEVAVRAGSRMQAVLRQPDATRSRPLMLRVGMHMGACIAVNLNDRLDYFGSTVNMAARLTGLSTGEDLVLSEEVYDDARVAAWLAERNSSSVAFRAAIRGFGSHEFLLWRVTTPAEPLPEVMQPVPLQAHLS